ncbi:MAG: DUF393 domain-containing protein [Planctomycetota bacterium]
MVASVAPATADEPDSISGVPASSRSDRTEQWEVEVFYDGDCPLCRKEINLLRRWDKRGVIVFTDIAASDFRPERVGVDFQTLMAEIHGRLPNGKVIVGVEVFRRLYAAVGFGWLVAPTRVPGIRHVLDLGYRFFARYRLALTVRRCDKEGCRID